MGDRKQQPCEHDAGDWIHHLDLLAGFVSLGASPAVAAMAASCGGNGLPGASIPAVASITRKNVSRVVRRWLMNASSVDGAALSTLRVSWIVASTWRMFHRKRR